MYNNWITRELNPAFLFQMLLLRWAKGRGTPSNFDRKELRQVWNRGS